jgi:hypothetical protein
LGGGRHAIAVAIDAVAAFVRVGAHGRVGVVAISADEGELPEGACGHDVCAAEAVAVGVHIEGEAIGEIGVGVVYEAVAVIVVGVADLGRAGKDPIVLVVAVRAVGHRGGPAWRGVRAVAIAVEIGVGVTIDAGVFGIGGRVCVHDVRVDRWV